MKKFIFLILLMPVFLLAQQQRGPNWIDEGATFENLLFEGITYVHTTDQVTFKNCTFRSDENGINIYEQGAKVEITFCTFEGLNPNKRGQSQGKAVHAYRAHSVTLENNTGTGFRGIWIQEPSGPTIIQRNRWLNIEGRPSNGNGGYLTQNDPNGENPQFLMLMNSNGQSVKVNWNYVEQEDGGRSMVEDVINFYDCHGTQSNPLELTNNLLNGAYGQSISYGSYSGTGIQIEATSSHVLVDNNTLVQCSNAALALSWATDNTVSNNTIIHTGYTPSGEYVGQVWRGMLIGNPFWEPDKGIRNEAFNNKVIYPQNTGNGNQIWGTWECLDGNTCSDNNILTRPATRADELTAIANWWDDAAANGIVIGASASPPNSDDDPDPDPGPGDEPTACDTVYITRVDTVVEIIYQKPSGQDVVNAIQNELTRLVRDGTLRISLSAKRAAAITEEIDKMNKE